MSKLLITPMLIAGVLLAGPMTTKAQSLDQIFNVLTGENKNNSNQSGTRDNKPGTLSNKGNLSNLDISNGLKEALKIGAQNAGKQLSVTDGFFRNAAIKILMPKEVQQVESALRSVGMGAIVDKAILSMNRAAEDASKKAAPIFINAISSISIQDGLSILSGGNNAATLFLKAKTTAELTNAFRPVIQNSLNKVGATTLWNKVFSTYNSLPLAQNKVNADLTGYVTEKALAGLFTTIAQEELKIRTNPSAQVSSILRKVFGG